jgi:hypothetical protein
MEDFRKGSRLTDCVAETTLDGPAVMPPVVPEVLPLKKNKWSQTLSRLQINGRETHGLIPELA